MAQLGIADGAEEQSQVPKFSRPPRQLDACPVIWNDGRLSLDYSIARKVVPRSLVFHLCRKYCGPVCRKGNLFRFVQNGNLSNGRLSLSSLRTGTSDAMVERVSHALLALVFQGRKRV